ncbi:MAG: hypothetical protein HC773_19510 [Scytonema sp. CRU_2_7]|nr:hypothetical protein [Scytonema sp. CRU_2_7]
MSKDNKYKLVENITEREMLIMYSVIQAPKQGKGFGIEDWKSKESIYTKLQELGTKDEKGNVVFVSVPRLELKISEHNILLEDLKNPIYANLEDVKTASKLIDKLNEAETLSYPVEG